MTSGDASVKYGASQRRARLIGTDRACNYSHLSVIDKMVRALSRERHPGEGQHIKEGPHMVRVRRFRSVIGSYEGSSARRSSWGRRSKLGLSWILGMSAASSTAAAVDIDGGGGITLTVNFITAPNPTRVPGGAGAGLDYCELMDAIGHRLWMQTEGTHFMRGVRFIQAPEGFGSDIEWHADSGSWGVVGGFPAAPQMEFHEVDDDAGLVNLMS